MGRCLSPCDGSTSAESYAEVVTRLRASLLASPEPVVGALSTRMGRLAAGQRFEEAGRFRDRLSAFLRGAARSQRIRALTRCPELVAARREDAGWAVHVVRHGRLAAAATSPPREHPRPTLDMARATAETVRSGPGPVPAATAEETERILAWLERPDTRLVETSGDWVSPARGAARFTGLLTRAEAAASVRDSAVRPVVTDRSDDARSLRL
jgi:DNA polymerase-3 subunit epsilon